MAAVEVVFSTPHPDPLPDRGGEGAGRALAAWSEMERDRAESQSQEIAACCGWSVTQQRASAEVLRVRGGEKGRVVSRVFPAVSAALESARGATGCGLLTHTVCAKILSGQGF